MKPMNEEKLKLLIKACSSGCSVKEACLYAGVPDGEFIQHCKENVGFADYCEALKLKPVSDSLVTLAEAVKPILILRLNILSAERKRISA